MKKLIYKVVQRLNSPENDFASTSYKIVSETIKTYFAQEGDSLGLCSAAHRNLNTFQDYNFDEGEWLYDLVLFKMSNIDNQIVEDIPLVLESELSDKSLGGLKIDFDKLMIATSSTKVFLTTSHNLSEKSNYIQKSLNAFNNFRYSETLYLIVWDESEGNFEVLEFYKIFQKN